MIRLCARVVLTVFLVAQTSTGQHPSLRDTSYQLYLTQVAAAEAFLQLNHISAARSYLDACDVRYRDVEWEFLRAGLDQSQRTVPRLNGSTVSSLQISPDGRVAAAACSDSTIVLSTYPGLEFIRELKGHAGPVSTIAFSHDGKKLASGGRDHVVILWDLATGKASGKNGGSFSQGIYQVKFSEDDSMLGVVSWERRSKIVPPVQGFVKVLDTQDAHELRRMDTDPHPAANVAFAPGDRELFVSTWGEILYSFEIATGKLNWKYDLSDPAEYNAFHSMDLSPDGKSVAVGSTDHRIHVLNSANGSLLHRVEPWQGHAKTVKAVQFSRDGKWLASAGEDQTILLWDTDGYRKKRALIGHVKTVTGLGWSIDGRTLLSSAQDGTIKQWDVVRGFETSYDICDFGPWQAPLSTDRRLFAAPCSDKNLALYEIATGTPLVRFGAQSGLCAALSGDARWLVTSSFDGVVRLWDAASGKEKKSFTGHTGRVDGVAILNSTESIISVGDTSLRLWSIRSGSEARLLPLNGAPFRVVVHPDESQVYVGFGSGVIRCFDTASWAEVGALKCMNGIQEIAVSPDGSHLAAFSGKGIEVWDITNFTRRFLLQGHEQAGYGLGFSPDGRYLISGSSDQTFKLWNLTNGACTLTYHGFDDVVYTSKFVSAGEILIGSAEGEMRYYRF